jgi:hypothetical protein
MEWNKLRGIIAEAFCIMAGGWHTVDLKIAEVATTSFRLSENTLAIRDPIEGVYDL